MPQFSLVDPFLKRPSVIVIEHLPEPMQLLVREIAQQADQLSALRYAYEVLSTRYRGYRFLTFVRFDRFLITDIVMLWKREGFLHCNHVNYLLHILLVASGKFTSEDIESRWTMIWFVSPHQYLLVHLENGETVFVDVWGRAYGIPFGSYAHGWQSGRITAVK